MTRHDLNCELESIENAILMSIKDLFKNDKELASNEDHSVNSGENSSSDRKLHEVCINHRLASYLGNRFQEIVERNTKIFVDIEFNRNGYEIKSLSTCGKIRPDIIIHNRKSGDQKVNLLIVEAKKTKDSAEDENVIKCLMNDLEFHYKYGLRIIYNDLSKETTKAFLYYKESGKIQRKKLEY